MTKRKKRAKTTKPARRKKRVQTRVRRRRGTRSRVRGSKRRIRKVKDRGFEAGTDSAEEEFELTATTKGWTPRRRE